MVSPNLEHLTLFSSPTSSFNLIEKFVVDYPFYVKNGFDLTLLGYILMWFLIWCLYDIN